MTKLSSIGELFFTTTGRLLISVATFACLFFVFHLAGHFDLRQSTVLAFGTALLVNRKHPFRPKPRLFEPFRIRFFPDFAAMLVAVGLVEDQEQWRASLDARKGVPFGSEDVERLREFACTMISLESSRARQLICWWPWNWYTSDYEISFGLRSVSYPSKPSSGDRGYLESIHSPSFFIGHYVSQGHSTLLGFGLEVDKQWLMNERQHMPELLTAFIAEIDDGENVKLVFGSLPLSAITWPNGDLDYYNRPVQQMVLLDRERDKTLQQDGWKTEEFGFYNHKFMTVRV